jgi:NAD-dependent dihydropyrimidine dehydrogenase PreA subunit
MPYKITDECTACGSCAEACPSEAIQEGEEQYTIDQDACIDCGNCVDTCPVGAIVEEG